MGEPRITDEDAELACYEVAFKCLAAVSCLGVVVAVAIIWWAFS